MAWLHADDMYFPWTLRLVGDIFARFPQSDGSPRRIPLRSTRAASPSVGKRLWFPQKGLLPRQLHLRSGLASSVLHPAGVDVRAPFVVGESWGFVDSSLNSAGDSELWARFFSARPAVWSGRSSGDLPASPLSKGLYWAEILYRQGDSFAQEASWRRGMLQLGPIDPAPRVTYNWAMEQWVIWYV
jgi:hypothetical protein